MSPVELSEEGSFVLLGEPGSGKSTVLRAVAERWRATLGDARVSEINAIGLTESRYRELVARHFAPLPSHDEVSAPADGVPDQVLIIDQLDECPILAQLHVFLREDLAGKSTENLRVVLACRLLDYSPALHAALRDVLAHRTCDLAPLTQAQAVDIANAEDVDAERLVNAASACGVGPFASIPLTLLMLCEMFRNEGDLVGSPVEIFDRAIGGLAERTSEASSFPAAGRAQRKQIATRIAARLLLSGRRNILTGPIAERRQTDLDLGDVAGGVEWDPDNSFDVTSQLVTATVGCALFAAAGPNRMTFRHSSVAAFMAAQYLVQHKVPEGQLRQLFLVETSAETRWLSIPALLRETAAWLLALRPEHGDWLIDADPLSLAAHSNFVDSAHARELLVAALLRTVDDTYLADVWWNRRKFVQLAHPGLGRQVLQALNEHAPEPSWRGHARIAILLELARDAADPSLASRLLEIASSDEWRATERRLASEAALACEPASASDLRMTLHKLADPAYARTADPDDELRGGLLALLWPRHLAPGELLPLLSPRQNPSLFGGYEWFLRTQAAASASDDDVAAVLSLIAHGVAATETVEDSYEAANSEAAADSSQAGDDEPPVHTSHGVLSRDFVMSIVGRALVAPVAGETIEAVATLLAPDLRRWQRVELPAPLDEVSSPESSQDVALLRRQLVEALCGKFDSVEAALAAHQIVAGWQPAPTWPLGNEATRTRRRRKTLLSANDFTWAVERAQHAWATNDRHAAHILAETAAMILDPGNQADYELAYAVYQSEPFAVGRLQNYFNAVPIDGPVARAWRRDEATEPKEIWDESDAFIAEVNRKLRAAVDGERGSFWQLAHALQFEPTTGRGHDPTRGDDILVFPAVRVLEGDAAALLRQAALIFLMTEHDHWREWLGSDRYDRRGWAGYFALCLLDRAGTPLTEIPWANWLGAILWSVPGNDDDERQRHGRLLAQAAASAPDDFTEAVSAFVSKALSRGSLPYGLDDLSAVLTPKLGIGLCDLVQNIRAALQPGSAELVLPDEDTARDLALQTWRTIARLALQVPGSGAVDEVLDTIDIEAGAEPSKLTIGAAVVLMNAHPELAWPRIRDSAKDDPVAGIPIAFGMGHQNYYGPNLPTLDDEQLAEMYIWLRTLLPPESDETYHRAHFVGAREDAQRLRDNLLSMLVDRGSARSIDLLLDLSRRFGRPLEIELALRRARAMRAEASWRPPQPAELVVLLADPARRLVRTDRELADLVIDALRAIEAELPAHGELLWDRIPAGVRRRALSRGVKLAYTFAPAEGDLWSPKPEAALAAYTASQLSLRLSACGVFVNREVLVLPRSAYGTGDRPDLLVQVAAHGNVLSRLPIEIKGSWNGELETSLRGQLVDRYLPEANARAGVYLVGWYPLEQWTLLDSSRRPKAAKRSVEGLLADFEAVAHAVRAETEDVIRPYVMSISRPHAAS